MGYLCNNDMTRRIKTIYKSSLKNEEFLMAVYSADGDVAPGMFASSQVKHMFVCIYYGWLVGQYGDNWESHL